MSSTSSTPPQNVSVSTLDGTATSAATMYESAFDTLSFSSAEGGPLSDDTINASVGSNDTLKSADSELDEAARNETMLVNTTVEEPKIKMYSNIDEFDANLPSTVTLLTTNAGSKVYLVGTAHFSEESQDDVSQVMRNVQPDILVVELCESRVHILRHDEKTLLNEARDINFAKVRSIIQTNGTINGVLYILLLKMSAKLTENLGMAPGGEFRRAAAEIRNMPWCEMHLGDRPINITLQRALQGLSMWQTTKLVWRLVTSNENISKEDVEQCKQKDLLEKLIEEMTGEFPAFGDVFVHERDLYLCHSLQCAAHYRARTNKVVGIVGIGHMAGIEKHWMKVTQDMVRKTLQIPPPSRGKRVFKFCFKYGLISVAAYGVFRAARPFVRTLL